MSSRVAFVTGGASGIGKGISLALAEAGFHVAVADLNLEAAEATATEITTVVGDALRSVAISPFSRSTRMTARRTTRIRSRTLPGPMSTSSCSYTGADSRAKAPRTDGSTPGVRQRSGATSLDRTAPSTTARVIAASSPSRGKYRHSAAMWRSGTRMCDAANSRKYNARGVSTSMPAPSPVRPSAARAPR